LNSASDQYNLAGTCTEQEICVRALDNGHLYTPAINSTHRNLTQLTSGCTGWSNREPAGGCAYGTSTAGHKLLNNALCKHILNATGDSLSGIPGNCYVLNSQREF